MVESAATVVEQICDLARSLEPEELSEPTASLTHSALYDAALRVFGAWDVALAAALSTALSGADHRDGGDGELGGSSTSRPPLVLVREPHPEALRPITALTDAGYLLSTPSRWLACATEVAAPRALLKWPDDVGRPVAFRDLGDSSGFAALADDGRVFGWDARMLPDADVGEGARRLGAAYGVTRWVSVGDRDGYVKAAYVVSVSKRGKVKGSETGLLQHPLPSDGTVVCLVDEGDDVVDLLAVGGREGLLLVSSDGYGIHFRIPEVRPMGLRAAGVIGMKLRGDAVVVGAIVPDRYEELAVISATGYAKRMPLDEFRAQSRAGLGLVTAKLARKDRLVAIAGVPGLCDLVITTDHGRCVRLPVEAIPAMGRPARGDRVLALDEGERVTDLAALLPMDFGG